MRERRRERLIYAFDTYYEIIDIAARAFWRITRRRVVRFFRHPQWWRVLIRIAFSASVPVAVLALIHGAAKIELIAKDTPLVRWVQDYSWIVSAALAALMIALAIMIRRSMRSHPFSRVAQAFGGDEAPSRVRKLLYKFLDNPKELLGSSYISIPDNPFALRFVRDDEIDEFSALNKEIFSATAFEYDYDVIVRRNLNVYKTNRLTTAFVVGRHDPERLLGICHVLPLTPAAADDYRVGRLGDNDITARHVAERGQTCGAVLLFSIGLLPQSRDREFNPRRDIAELFTLHAVRILVSIIQERNNLPPTVEFLAQCDSNETALAKILEENDFERTDYVSRDGFPVWRFGIVAPSAKQGERKKSSVTAKSRPAKVVARPRPKRRPKATAK